MTKLLETIAQVTSLERPSVVVNVETTTTPKLGGGKKNPFAGRVSKRSKFKGLITNNSEINTYEQLVKGGLVAEGKSADDFEVGRRVWGERVDDTALIVHNGQQYLEVLPMEYTETVYLVDGQEFTGDVADLNIYVAPSAKTGQGGLEERVRYTCYKLESITDLSIAE